LSVKCSFCNREAVYFRPYSGEYLCKRCFSRSVVEKVKRTISKYEMLEHGDRIGVGVSGGKDSLSLLYILNGLAKRHGSELISITIDEGIKGYSWDAMKLAKEFSEGLGVEHYPTSFKEIYGYTLDELIKLRDEKGLRASACSICGTLRRKALDLIARKLKLDALATAHNLDDMVQTFLINLMNGDLEKLKWLKPKIEGFGIKRVKPFSELYEREILAFSYLNEIPIFDKVCPYAREGIRWEVRRMLDRLEFGHPGVKYTMLRSALKLGEGIEEERPTHSCVYCGMPSSSRVCNACKMLLSLGVEPRPQEG